ncbi:MAG: hypothetical protein ACXQS8_05395 [Candidatus Helarchaeales archaeon]
MSSSNVPNDEEEGRNPAIPFQTPFNTNASNRNVNQQLMFIQSPSKQIHNWLTRNIILGQYYNVKSIIAGLSLALISFFIPFCLLFPHDITLALISGILSFLSIFGTLTISMHPVLKQWCLKRLIKRKDVNLMSPITPLIHYFWKPEETHALDEGEVMFLENEEEIHAFKSYELQELPIQLGSGSFRDLLKSIEAEQIPFTCTFSMHPIPKEEILKGNLAGTPKPENERAMLLYDIAQDYGGHWKARMLMSTMNRCKKYEGLYMDNRAELWKQVCQQGLRLKALFEMIFNNAKIGSKNRTELIEFMLDVPFEQAPLRVLLSGREAARHFFHMPEEMIKSIHHRPNADFIVPTSLPFNHGPIGHAWETSWQHPESPVGLLDSQLYRHVLITGDDPAKRHEISKILLDVLLKNQKKLIIITKNRSLRNLASKHEKLLVLRLGIDLSFNFLDNEIIDPTIYVTYITKIFEACYDLSPQTMVLLKNELNDAYRLSRDEKPDLTMVSGAIFNQLKEKTRMDFQTAREFQQIERLISTWHQGYLSRCFHDTSITMEKLLHQLPLLIEIDPHALHEHEIIGLYLLFKILLTAREQKTKDIVIFSDLAEIFKGEPRHPCLTHEAIFSLCHEINAGLIQTIPHLSTTYPSFLLARFRTLITGNVRDSIDLRILLPLLGIDPKNRKQQPRITYLRSMEKSFFLYKRPDTLEAFPIKIEHSNTLSQFKDEDISRRLEAILPNISPVRITEKNTALENYFYTNRVPPDDPQSYLPYIVLKDLRDSTQSRIDGIATRTSMPISLITRILDDAIKYRLVMPVEATGYTYYVLDDSGISAVDEFQEFYGITE